MAETFDITIDSEAYAAVYWYAGTLELFGEEHSFSVSTDDSGSILSISWTDEFPTDDSELLELIEKDITNNFG
jgi:hypothetical protein